MVKLHDVIYISSKGMSQKGIFLWKQDFAVENKNLSICHKNHVQVRSVFKKVRREDHIPNHRDSKNGTLGLT